MKNIALILCLTFSVFLSVYSLDVFEYDVVVYGSTPSGIMATVAAGRLGKRVAMISIGTHIGGMTSGGLSKSDRGNDSVIGGFAMEFFQLVTHYYNSPELTLNAEPHVAERLFWRMLSETDNVDVYLQQRLKETDGVQVDGDTIISITTEKNVTFYSKIFIDATYEGDLMAFSKIVSFTWGRESSSQYNESQGGVRPFVKEENIVQIVNPFYPNGTLLPMVTEDPQQTIGQADKRIQAYSYRLCLTQNKHNSIPITKPPRYNPDNWILLSRYIEAWTLANNKTPIANDIFQPFPIENGKTDVCEYGNWGISTDFVGGADAYPNSTYAIRDSIANAHYEYVAGLLYFLSNDPSVPESTRLSVSSWGLAADEFVDNNNWPYQLYVRESLRMIGDHVFTQKDVDAGPKYRADSIGMGSWLVDTHQMQRFASKYDTHTKVQYRAINEGTTWYFPNPHISFQAYPIPYYVITPKKSEVRNLLVSICISASHVGFNSIRLETQYMILGQAAGVAASLAIENNVPVQNVEIQQLTKILASQGAVLNL